MLHFHPRLLFSLCKHSYLPVLRTSPADVIFLDLIILIIFGEILQEPDFADLV
jgi:hypothetical protein